MLILPNRDKAINELTRRYDEVLRKAENGIHNDEEAEQFVSLVAHYVYFVKKTELTRHAVDTLFEQQELLAGDQALIDKADEIIVQMNADRSKVRRYMSRNNITIEPFNLPEGTFSLTPDQSLSLTIQSLDQFLGLPSDQQRVSDVPSKIGDLRSICFRVQEMGGENRALKAITDKYIQISNDFTKKLKMQGVYMDYLRVQDYKALEVIWREVYQESRSDDSMIFHFMYSDLFERHRNYDQRLQQTADDFVGKHITHLQRVHNYLIDKMEDVPRREKFFHWTVEHFGPTLASLILIIIIYLALNWVGIKININALKNVTGL